MESENFILKLKYKQFDKKEIELQLIKIGNTIEKQIVQTSKKQRIFWMLIGTGLVIGAHKLLNFIIQNLYQYIGI